MIIVIDYGAGNLRSVVNALTLLGYSHRVSQKPADVLSANTVILPGVGAAGDTMKSLEKLALTKPIKQYIAENRPFLGICIGLQVLLSTTKEGGEQKCLGIIPGRVRRLSEGVKIPHMGWNQVKQLKNHPVFAGIPDNTNFYFVHSYYAVPENNVAVIGTTDYGISFCSVLAQGKLVATQFHPEKSGEWGLKLYDNFMKMAGEKR
ncbi:MAG TPA: imidazole glycerol phosphate synthase subunit HisH [Dehalococcoidales bacterium]